MDAAVRSLSIGHKEAVSHRTEVGFICNHRAKACLGNEDLHACMGERVKESNASISSKYLTPTASMQTELKTPGRFRDAYAGRMEPPNKLVRFQLRDRPDNL